MQKLLLIVVALAVSSLAAPATEKDVATLQRPSPINPDVVTDPKPKTEQIVLIPDADPQHEDAPNSNRRLQQNVAAAALLQRTKRDQPKLNDRVNTAKPPVKATTGNIRDHTVPTPIKTTSPKVKRASEAQSKPAHAAAAHPLPARLSTEKANEKEHGSPLPATSASGKSKRDASEQPKHGDEKVQNIDKDEVQVEDLSDSEALGKTTSSKVAQAIRPKRETPAVQQNEQKPLGTQNLRGQLPKEESIDTEVKSEHSQHDALVKRASEGQSKPAHATAAQPAHLPTEKVNGKEQQHDSHLAATSGTSKTKRDVPTTLVPKHGMKVEDSSDRKTSSPKVAQATRPKRETPAVQQNEQKPLGIQNLRGQLPEEESIDTEAKSEHSQHDALVKRASEGQSKPAHAAAAQPAHLPTEKVNGKEQQHGSHLAATSGTSKTKRDVPTTLVPKHGMKVEDSSDRKTSSPKVAQATRPKRETPAVQQNEQKPLGIQNLRGQLPEEESIDTEAKSEHSQHDALVKRASEGQSKPAHAAAAQPAHLPTEKVNGKEQQHGSHLAATSGTSKTKRDVPTTLVPKHGMKVEDSSDRKTSSPKVAQATRPKRETPAVQQNEQKPLGIQNLRGQLPEEESIDTEAKSEHSQHDALVKRASEGQSKPAHAAAAQPAHLPTEKVNGKEQQHGSHLAATSGTSKTKRDVPTTLVPKHGMKVEDSSDRKTSSPKVAQATRPKRETPAVQQNEQKPLGIQNLRGQLPEEESIDTEAKSEHSQHDALVKRASEGQSKPAHAAAVQPLPAHLPTEKVNEKEQQHGSHLAVTSGTSKTKRDVPTTLVPKHGMKVEDSSDRKTSSPKVAQATRPKRETPAVQQNEQKPLGIQNLRGQLPEEESIDTEAKSEHSQHDALVKRASEGQSKPAHAAPAHSQPADLPAVKANGNEKEHASHLLATNASVKSKRDASVQQTDEKAQTEHKDDEHVQSLSDAIPPAQKQPESYTGSSTTPPTLLRRYPVPVAELFNRPKQQLADDN